MKTPEQIIKEIIPQAEEGPVMDLWIDCMVAYHEQFTITPSERERKIVREAFIWALSKNIMYDDFFESEVYQSIPPAMPMPTREEAREWIEGDIYNGIERPRLYVIGAMAMYDYLIERAKQ